MKNLTSILIGTVIVAWAAYLSWPMTSDFPPARSREAEVTPRSKAKPIADAPDADAYEVCEPKAVQPSA